MQQIRNLRSLLKNNHLPKMTVLFLIDQLNTMGGAERNLLQVVTSLQCLGHTPIVACMQGGEVSSTIEKNGIQVENLSIDKIYNLAGCKALFVLKNIIIRQQVDLIVAYHESSDFMGIILSIITRTPIISNRRDMGFRLQPRHILTYQLINRFFSHLVTVSTAVKNSVAVDQKCPEHKITVIYNGVELHEISGTENFKNELGFTNDQLLICCLANIRLVKGHKYLIESMRLILEKYPDVRLLLLGQADVTHNYCEEIKALVTRYNLGEIVHFKGKISPGEVGKWLQVCDISVLPSLSEGFSNTLLESMAAGLPVVATNVGGNPEIVADGVSGYIVPPADPASLANALDKLLSNETLRVKMGKAGRQIVESKFSKEIMIDKYLDLFTYSCLEKNSGY